MNVLIVHDRLDVAEEIATIVSDICPKATYQQVDNAADARAWLAEKFFDLMILDLTIPVVSKHGERAFHVAEGLLEELFASPNLSTPGNIIGITFDAAALEGVQNNIGPHLMAVISEDIDGRWRRQLEDRIRYVLSSSESRVRSLLTQHAIDLLVVTALDKELAPYREFFGLQESTSIPGLSEFVFMDRDGRARRGGCYAIGRAGQPSAASDTQGLLCQLRPRLVIMTGFCGGVPGKVNLGDVLFAETAIDWDYGKWKPSETAAKLYSRPEPVVIRNSRAHRIARKIVADGLPDAYQFRGKVAELSDDEIKEPSFHLTPFASGSAVIGDQDVLESIRSLNDNTGGVDMESFGFYFACEYTLSAKPDFICIKGVADDCGPEKDDRLHAACCYSSAYVAHVIATQLWDYS